MDLINVHFAVSAKFSNDKADQESVETTQAKKKSSHNFKFWCFSVDGVSQMQIIIS